MNEQVTAYIQDRPAWQKELCEKLRRMVFDSIPDVEERLQYGKPHYLKNGSYAAVISAAKDKISFMLFNAAEIEAEKSFIRAMGNGERKVIDISEGQDVDIVRLADLLKQSSSTL